MTGKRYILKEEDGAFRVNEALLLKPEEISQVSNRLRTSIIKMLAKRPMYASEIAKDLGLHEQKVYYHINRLRDTGIIEETGRKDVRGATAKMYKAAYSHFCTSITESKGRLFESIKDDRYKKPLEFFSEAIDEGSLTAKIAVGSPDPHGPHKARARDGHYAVDLSLFLGRLCQIPEGFTTSLDVDTDLKNTDSSLVVVGGPVTNLLTEQINKYLEKGFTEQKPWGLKGNDIYSEDSIGLIAKLPNPHKPSLSVFLLAGIGNIGTKAAVIAITRHTKLTLSRYTGQKQFSAIVQGFDMDGDGRIDSIELLE